VVGNYSSKHDVWNDTSSCLEWSIVVNMVVRFGEGTFVIGTCKKPAWTLMMSCGTWNERESKCVLSMACVLLVSLSVWGGCYTIPVTSTCLAGAGGCGEQTLGWRQYGRLPWGSGVHGGHTHHKQSQIHSDNVAFQKLELVNPFERDLE
jgi:hypothetical protein